VEVSNPAWDFVGNKRQESTLVIDKALARCPTRRRTGEEADGQPAAVLVVVVAEKGLLKKAKLAPRVELNTHTESLAEAFAEGAVVALALFSSLAVLAASVVRK